MIKKLLPLLAAPLLLFSSCSEISSEQELNKYSDCIVYSYDTATGTGHVSNFASIEVKGDMASGYYQLNFNDFQLADGATLQSGIISRLIQYMKDETDSDGNLQNVDYIFFKQQPDSRQSGTLDISDMYFGWLSTTYWLNFDADGGRYKVWSIPARIPVYANANTVNGPYGKNEENAISPRYDMSIDPARSTVAFKATGVKFPIDKTDPNKSWEFRQMNWSDIPVTFTERGFTMAVSEFNPRIDGSDTDYTIINFSGTFDYSFEGTHSVSYSIINNATGLRVHVTTKLDYFFDKK